jgi:outer membrane lipoprotein carrier protein
LAASAVLLACCASMQAQAPTAASLAQVVDNHYNHLQSLKARYSERYQGMNIDRTDTGTLTLRKPGRMRWAYDSPAGKVFVMDGKDAISYTPGDPQAQRIPGKQLDDLRSPLRFLLGYTKLSKELDNLTLTPAQGGLFTLTGIPKGMANRVHSLVLTVDAAGAIHSLRIEEIDGAATNFTFTDMHENVPTKDSDFVFVPPPGVMVVTGAPPM